MRYNLLGSRFDSSGLVGIVHIRNVRRAGNRQIQAQDYSGFGFKVPTPTPKSAQLASRAPARAAARPEDEPRGPQNRRNG
jgi:hypothetical protein